MVKLILWFYDNFIFLYDFFFWAFNSFFQFVFLCAQFTFPSFAARFLFHNNNNNNNNEFIEIIIRHRETSNYVGIIPEAEELEINVLMV